MIAKRVRDHEINSLKNIRNLLLDPTNQIKQKTRQIKILKIVGFLSLFACFLTSSAISGYFFIIIGLACFSGISYSVATLNEISLAQWPILSKHLNLESIEQRISELESQESSNI